MGGPGGDRRSEAINRDNVPAETRDDGTGNGRLKAIRRLQAQRPDLLAKVQAGALSPHAACIEAGWRSREPGRCDSGPSRILPPSRATTGTSTICARSSTRTTGSSTSLPGGAPLLATRARRFGRRRAMRGRCRAPPAGLRTPHRTSWPGGCRAGTEGSSCRVASDQGRGSSVRPKEMRADLTRRSAAGQEPPMGARWTGWPVRVDRVSSAWCASRTPTERVAHAGTARFGQARMRVDGRRTGAVTERQSDSGGCVGIIRQLSAVAL